MTAALTPDQAVSYVRELSADVTAVVVLAADGSPLAGPPVLAGPAAALLEAAGDAPLVALRAPEGVAFAARTATHAVVAVAGPLSLLGPTALDVRAAAAALGTGPQPAAEDAGPPDTAVGDERLRAAKAVISATHGAI